ncbi:hypothetical protein EGR_10302 [Echinococcus granulosus]|uniref:Uncharacterized protein n=1 Tax=Echinococcus granulosus TaxID=6210 RepID=W6U8M6_ECHGR|nr:hypothetical protein EGR_10302 [Echinococcus granulosus]EUB54837.1 hypothetical protein EGR_10302 [Echinococcus granulosus]
MPLAGKNALIGTEHLFQLLCLILPRSSSLHPRLHSSSTVHFVVDAAAASSLEQMHGSRVDEGGSLHELECASTILAFFFSPPSSFLPPLPPPPLPPSPHPHLPNSLHSSSRSHLYSSLPQAQPPSSSTAPSPSHFFFSSRFICLPRFLFVFTYTASLLLPLTFTLVSVPSSTTFPSRTPSLPSPTNTHTPIESVALKVDKLCVIMYRVGIRGPHRHSQSVELDHPDERYLRVDRVYLSLPSPLHFKPRTTFLFCLDHPYYDLRCFLHIPKRSRTMSAYSSSFSTEGAIARPRRA